MKHFILLILFAITVVAQENPEWKNYANTENVCSIDGIGNTIWFCTSNGLVKYDKITGEKFIFNKGNTPLPSNVFFNVKVEDENTIWFGTANGIVKHTGNDWIIYDTTNTLIPTNWVTRIEIDREGTKWFCTDKGLIKYDNTTWSVYNTLNSILPGNVITSIAVDSLNRVWVGTGGGLIKIDDNKWTLYNSSNSELAVSSINALAIEDTTIWVGVLQTNQWTAGTGGGVFGFNGRNWVNFLPSDDRYVFKSVSSIAVDKEGNKWFGALVFNDFAGGLYHISNNTLIKDTIPVASSYVKSIFADDNNTVWIGSSKNALKQNGNSWETISTSTVPFTRNSILNIQFDNKGKLWCSSFLRDIPLSGMGLPLGAITTFDDSEWKRLSTDLYPNLYNGVACFDIDKGGTVWCGITYQANIVKIKDTTVSIISSPLAEITSVFAEEADRIWYYDNRKGMFLFTNNQWKEISGYTFNEFYYAKKRDNTLWFATAMGLVKSTDGGNTFVLINSLNSGLPSNFVSAFDFDSFGNMWLATSKGLVNYDGTNWTVYNSSNSPLTWTSYSTLAVDKTNNVWLGVSYPMNLIQFDGINWKIFNKNNSGLPDIDAGTLNGIHLNNTLNKIIVDSLNHIWIATNGGIAVYDRNGVHVPVELTSFTASIKNNCVNLQWQTATETNNNGFEVQRKINNEEWIPIGFVKGNGTTTEIKEYKFADSHPVPGNQYYRLKQIDYNGNFKYSNEAEVNFSGDMSFFLAQNYPNPFNPTTTISYSLPTSSFVSLKIYDMLGSEVTALVNENKPAGIYKAEFNGINLPSGVYLYRLNAGKYSSTKKFMIIK